jgi:hypothetical protein
MTTLIQGEIVNLGGTDYTVPALTIRQIRELGDKIQSLSKINPLTDGAESLDPLLDVAHAALSRNYPDLKREQMDDLVDLRNTLPLLNAILNTSGFTRAGEARAGSQ